MKKIIALIIIIASSVCCYAREIKISTVSKTPPNSITVDSMPPVVVKTSPVAGNKFVNPSTKEIKITFSKEMQTKEMWSCVMINKSSFPQIAGKIGFESDKKTCVIPVILEPNKTYSFWLNSQRFNSFRDKTNKPAIPYLLTFQTAKTQ